VKARRLAAPRLLVIGLALLLASLAACTTCPVERPATCGACAPLGVYEPRPQSISPAQNPDTGLAAVPEVTAPGCNVGEGRGGLGAPSGAEGTCPAAPAAEPKAVDGGQ
jgi:hypothetical protein